MNAWQRYKRRGTNLVNLQLTALQLSHLTTRHNLIHGEFIRISWRELHAEHSYCRCVSLLLLPPSSPSWCRPSSPSAPATTSPSRTVVARTVRLDTGSPGDGKLTTITSICADVIFDDACRGVATYILPGQNICTSGPFKCSPPPIRITDVRIDGLWCVSLIAC